MFPNSGTIQRRSGLWVPEEYDDGSEFVPSPTVRAYTRIRATQANDSVAVTPGSGVLVATHLANGKEYQVMMVADPDGHLHNSRDEWFVWFTPATNSATRVIGQLFNADAAVIVRVRGVWIVPTVTALTGIGVSTALNMISAVGTGGTTVTPVPADTAQSALDADITARFSASGGGTFQHKYTDHYHFNEETNASTALIQHQNLLPSSIGNRVAEVILRQNKGLELKHIAGGSVGLTGALMYFTTE